MPIKLRCTPRAECCQDTALPAADKPVLDASEPTTSHHDGLDDELPAPPFVSLRESADWLCVSISTLKRLVANGELSTIRVGARQKIPANHLAAYIARDILLPSQIIDTVGPEQD
jgi:excisionase family DNA binding protein